MEKRFWLEYASGGVIGFPVQEFGTREACDQHLLEKRASSEHYPEAVVCEGEWGKCSVCNSIISTRPLENYERFACEGGLCPNCKFGYRVIQMPNYGDERVVIVWFDRKTGDRICRSPLLWLSGGGSISIDAVVGVTADHETLPLVTLPQCRPSTGDWAKPELVGCAQSFMWQGEALPCTHCTQVSWHPFAPAALKAS